MLAYGYTGAPLVLPVLLLVSSSAALTLGCKAGEEAVTTDPAADAPPTEAPSADPVLDGPADAPSPAKAKVPAHDNLIDAARARDSASVSSLLAGGADPNEPDERGATPLFFAVRNNDTDMIAVLAKAGADLNSEGGFFEFALGIDADRTEAAIALIELGADIEAAGHSGRGPLQAACSSGNEKVARLLIEKGASVNTNRGMVGMTPLHYAAVSGSTEIVELLIARGANVNAIAKSGNTALHYGGDMMSAGNPEVARLLIKNGAKANAKNEKGQTPLTYARKNRQDAYADEIAKHGGTED